MSITQELLRKLFHYDPATGVFTRLVSTTQSVKVGDTAGSLHHTGYLHIQINDHIYGAHRLAWVYSYGEFPPNHLDHINGDRADNRLCNLRLATHFQNTKNAKKRVDNTSGFKGVSFFPTRGDWVARCQVDGKRTCVGHFKTPELAAEAYRSFAQEHHGEFFRDTAGLDLI